jgi:hypothetical protein
VPTEAWGETNSQTAEMWFRTSESGVLLTMQNEAFGERPTGWWPMLIVDSDGKLRGRMRYPGDSATLMSRERVDDDTWHHVVLTANSEGQLLIL